MEEGGPPEAQPAPLCVALLRSASLVPPSTCHQSGWRARMPCCVLVCTAPVGMLSSIQRRLMSPHAGRGLSWCEGCRLLRKHWREK
jgi:hypothetical protein